MKRRGKTIALSAVAVGLVVLVAAGIVSKDRILEKWYLHQLETGTPEAKEQALQILAKVGSEESLMKLEEYRLHDAPVIIFRWGLPGHEGSKVVPVPKADVVIKRVLPSGGGVDRAGRVVVE